MNYVYANDILWIVENVNQIIFQKSEDEQLKDIIDLNEHTLTIEFPEGCTSGELAELVKLVSYNPNSKLTEGTWVFRQENVIVNNYHVFYKVTDTWITLTQIITDKVEEVTILEENNTTVILVPNDEVTEDYNSKLLTMEHLLIIPVEDTEQYITNIDSLSIHDSFVYTGTNKQRYTEDNYWMNAADYAAAFMKFITWRHPEAHVYQSSDEQSVPPDHHKIYVFNIDELFARNNFSTHRIFDEELGYIMQTEIPIKGEFLTDDFQTYQTFISDWNNNLDINKDKEFVTYNDYDNPTETPAKRSKEGWHASLLWTDFVEGNLDNKTSSKMFENSNLYSVPIDCTIVGITAKGTEEGTRVLSFVVDVLLKYKVKTGIQLLNFNKEL